MGTLVLLLTLGVFLAGRVPIAFALGLASVTYLFFFLPDVPLGTIAQQMYAGADSFTLTAIPFFVLVGEIMNAGGISRRLVHFTRTIVGHLTGGMGVVSLVSSMIFASISGSAVANAAGTGAITIPAMIRSGYPRGLAAAIESVSSSLGAIIPPSIPMIVYGTIAGVSIGGLFVGGYVPAILFGLALVPLLRASAARMGVPVDPRSSLQAMLRAGREAAPALLAPVLIMGGILGGVMTPTEAGAIGALYAFVVAYVFYRDLTLNELPRVLLKTAVTTGVVMLVMTVASVFSWIMAFEGIPAAVASQLSGSVGQPWLLMLGIVALLIVVGTFIDTISALTVLTPVLVPVATQAGIDPLFLGVIVSTALTLGVCTPPVGVVLFVTSSIANTSVEDTSRAGLPFIAVLIGWTFVLALLPQVILWLPHLFGFN